MSNCRHNSESLSSLSSEWKTLEEEEEEEEEKKKKKIGFIYEEKHNFSAGDKV